LVFHPCYGGDGEENDNDKKRAPDWVKEPEGFSLLICMTLDIFDSLDGDVFGNLMLSFGVSD